MDCVQGQFGGWCMAALRRDARGRIGGGDDFAFQAGRRAGDTVVVQVEGQHVGGEYYDFDNGRDLNRAGAGRSRRVALRGLFP